MYSNGPTGQLGLRFLPLFVLLTGLATASFAGGPDVDSEAELPPSANHSGGGVYRGNYAGDGYATRRAGSGSNRDGRDGRYRPTPDQYRTMQDIIARHNQVDTKGMVGEYMLLEVDSRFERKPFWYITPRGTVIQLAESVRDPRVLDRLNEDPQDGSRSSGSPRRQKEVSSLMDSPDGALYSVYKHGDYAEIFDALAKQLGLVKEEKGDKKTEQIEMSDAGKKSYGKRLGAVAAMDDASFIEDSGMAFRKAAPGNSRKQNTR